MNFDLYFVKLGAWKFRSNWIVGNSGFTGDGRTNFGYVENHLARFGIDLYPESL
jgi:hypothetical protein